MVKSLLLVTAIAAVAVVRLPSARACDNAVEWTTDDYVGVVVRAEKQVEAGQFGRAKKTLGKMWFPASLQPRVKDLRAVLALRTSTNAKDLEAAATHFKARTEAKGGENNVRFRAMLAEAYLATGHKDDARAILVDLNARDLMPDAYAYLALAKLSTGTERLAAWKACRTRTTNKEMCDLPAEIKSPPKAQARR